MSLFAISDLHLSFAETIEKPMDVFGPEWYDHAERLRAAWLDIVGEEDTVVIPGDISWGMSLAEAKPDLAFIDSLPGRKLLLRGNHDYWWTSMKKMRGLYGSVDFIQNDAYEGENYVLCGTRSWYLPWNPPKDMTSSESEKILRRELLRMRMSLDAAKKLSEDKPLIAAMHFPPLDVQHKETAVTQLLEEYGVKIALYGHLHGRHREEAVEGRVGNIEYRLVSLDKLDAKPVKVV